jgi:hypothetical protein
MDAEGVLVLVCVAAWVVLACAEWWAHATGSDQQQGDSQ